MANEIYSKLQQDDETITDTRLSGFTFSAGELRKISGWPLELIEDYLSKTGNIFTQGSIEQDIIDAVLDLNRRVTALEGQVSWLTPTSITTNVSTTSAGNQFIFCTNRRPNIITITLNSQPLDAERVWITRGDYTVLINGNGRQINRSFEIKMQRKNETRAIEYNAQLDEWVVV